MTQKPRVLNTKYLEKLFEEKHDKYLELLSRPMRLRNQKKLKFERSLNFKTKLPNISSTSTDGFYSKLRSSTENNMETTNEQSKENSLELTDHRRNEMIHNKAGSLYTK